MHFFITAIKICHTHIRPTQTSEKIFSMDSLTISSCGSVRMSRY